MSSACTSTARSRESAPSPTEQLRAEVHAIIDRLSHDELRVFRFNGRRVIDIGHAKYGPLDLSNDRRDWKRERAEESADGVFFYDALVQIAEADREQEDKERGHCKQADRVWSAMVGPDGFGIVVETAPALPDPVASFQCLDGVVEEVLT